MLSITIPQAGAVRRLGSPPDDSGTYLYGLDVRRIPDTHFFLENINGQPTLDNPPLLIHGVPNETSLTPAISALSVDTASGPVYKTDLNSGDDVYTVLGLGDGTNNLNSFTNWTAADLAVNGNTDYYFGFFVNDLDNTGVTGGSTEDVSFFSDLPIRTFSIAYG